MNIQPKLIMPLVPPPDATQSDPVQFYPSLNATVDVDAPATGEGMQITIDKPDALWPDSQYSNQCKRSTVFAIAKGFVRFYPAAANLPTPDGQPMTVPPEMAGLDVGTVIQQIWFDDYRKLGTVVESQNSRTTHVAYIALDKESVRAAFTSLVASMHRKALVKSWTGAGGTGVVPDTATLRTLFADRVMSGDASVFAPLGTPIGNAAKVTVIPPNNSTPVAAGRFTLQTYFESSQSAQTGFTDPQDAIDSIFEVEADGVSNPYDKHPLVDDVPIGVIFEATFLIWNNLSHSYEVLGGCNISLYTVKDDVQVATDTTAVDGTVTLSATLKRRDKIRFEANLQINNRKVGTHTYTEFLATQTEMVRRYLDRTTNKRSCVYQLKYRVNKGYRAFYDELRVNEKTEQFDDDRGNAEARIDNPNTDPLDDVKSWRGRLYINSLMDGIDECESYYAGASSYAPSDSGGAGDDTNAVNILFEGDSWLSYPIPTGEDKSIFTHLDESIRDYYKNSIRKYHRVPLQHHGDRSDQMFGNPTASTGKHQWHYTTEFLDEYSFKLIFLSGGGNDFAEPGLSSSAADLYGAYYTPNIASQGGTMFDPDKIGLNDPNQAMFLRKIESSFAVLLKNHPWNLYLRNRSLPANAKLAQATAAAIKNTVDGFLTNLGFNPSQLPATVGADESALEAAASIIKAQFQDTDLHFPGSAPDNYNGLLQFLFDEVRLTQRFAQVKTELETLLTYAQGKNIKVLTHTYCYPFYNEAFTTSLGFYVAGPWFKPRFLEANITSRFVRMICLKSILDNHVRLVLAPLKTQFPLHFDYVDVRTTIEHANLWNDEMHLKEAGFTLVANEIFNYLITPRPANTSNSLIPPP